MKMSIDQILEKAFTSGDLSGGTNGGLLGPEQAAKFVQGVIDNSVIINECRREPMKATKREIDKITYTGAVLQKPNAVGTAPSTTTKPTTSKVTLDAQETIVACDIGYDSLEDSIEGQGLFQTILNLTSKQLALDMDTLLLNGVSSAGTTYLDILDGVFQQISTYTYDALAASMSDTVLFKILRKMPGKYVDQQESSMRFYVSHLARLDYVNALAGKGVNEAFVRYLIEAAEPMYNGIPVRKVPAILTESITEGTGTANGSKALLINPKNIIWGIHRDITMEFQRQPRKRIIEVTITCRVDVKLEEEKACVKATNIKHSV
jgi:HK97 family phage major capsid protein